MIRTLVFPFVVLLGLVWLWTHPSSAGGLGAAMQSAWYGPILAAWNGPLRDTWNTIPPSLRALVLVGVVILVLVMVLGGNQRRRGMAG